eukprot:scaffold29330_cov64-Phaeocystis_antarctica.AAC.2
MGRASAGSTQARRASPRCSSRASCATCCRRRAPSRRRDPANVHNPRAQCVASKKCNAQNEDDVRTNVYFISVWQLSGPPIWCSRRERQLGPARR